MTKGVEIEIEREGTSIRFTPIRDEDFNFVQNTNCRYFPCHSTIDIAEFNCLFCYCPLMFVEQYGMDCGGNYTLLENGFKDCSKCTLNHDKNSWKYVVNKLRDLMQVKTNIPKREHK